MKTVTYKLMPTLNSYGWAEQDFHAAIRATWSRFFESIATVRFKEVGWRASANFSVSCKEIYINGQHYRGTVSGSTIYLHNGWCSKGHSPYPYGFWWKVMGSLDGAQQIASHELCHMSIVGFGGNAAHCRDATCTFSSNAGSTWCIPHHKRIVKRFGALLTKAYSDGFTLCPEKVTPTPE